MHCPPLEICEVVIDDVADDDELTLRNHHLSQLALVCRSWVPRARFHLYRFICIGNGTQFDSFRHSLRILPERCSDIRLLCLWGHRDTNLKKGAIPTTRDSSTKYLRDAVCTLPWRVPHLQRLELGYLPILHPTFIPLCSEFKAVVALSLQHLTHQTAVEIVNIINRFPQLRTLRLVDCQWSRPSQRLPIHLPFLDDLQVELPDVDCRRDCIGWFFPNDSKSGITKLQWSIYEPLGDELVDVLKRSPALRVISLTAVSPKTFCGLPCLLNNVALEELEYVVCGSEIKEFINRLSQLHQTNPPSIKGTRIMFHDQFSSVFGDELKEDWLVVDEALKDPRLRNVNMIVFGFLDVVDPTKAENTFRSMMPSSCRRGILSCSSQTSNRHRSFML
ncbi:hypothetical protein NLI96_g8726 [Meripilus lineatus]|uniref:F-box domain-containing protein n=1 Tax=Meripilus lineatus TaxID=2056292 RepID=A0AAD5UWR0_9APHY|nr:hypothetical protein NLI96_g8726 [Physisporinus lineatus]